MRIEISKTNNGYMVNFVVETWMSGKFISERWHYETLEEAVKKMKELVNPKLELT